MTTREDDIRHRAANAILEAVPKWRLRPIALFQDPGDEPLIQASHQDVKQHARSWSRGQALLMGVTCGTVTVLLIAMIAVMLRPETQGNAPDGEMFPPSVLADATSAGEPTTQAQRTGPVAGDRASGNGLPDSRVSGDQVSGNPATAADLATDRSSGTDTVSDTYTETDTVTGTNTHTETDAIPNVFNRPPGKAAQSHADDASEESLTTVLQRGRNAFAQRRHAEHREALQRFKAAADSTTAETATADTAVLDPRLQRQLLLIEHLDRFWASAEQASRQLPLPAKLRVHEADVWIIRVEQGRVAMVVEGEPREHEIAVLPADIVVAIVTSVPEYGGIATTENTQADPTSAEHSTPADASAANPKPDPTQAEHADLLLDVGVFCCLDAQGDPSRGLQYLATAQTAGARLEPVLAALEIPATRLDGVAALATARDVAPASNNLSGTIASPAYASPPESGAEFIAQRDDKPAAESTGAATQDATVDSPDDPRAEVPDTTDQASAQKEIRTVYADGFRVQTPDAQQEFARELLKQAQQTNDNPSARYVMMQTAAQLAAESGALDVALQATSDTARDYRIDGLQQKAEILAQYSSATRKPQVQIEVVLAVEQTLAEALRADRFDVAKQLIRLGHSAARRSRQRELATRVVDLQRRFDELEKSFDASQRARRKLAEEPDDADSHFELARYLCFFKDDWENGLGHLSQVEDETLRQLAAEEAKQPAEPEPQVELGDLWWKQAARATRKDRDFYQARACYWYKKAQPELSGLTLARVEQRLESFDASMAEDVSPGGPSLGKPIELTLAERVTLTLRPIRPGRFVQDDGTNQRPVALTREFFLGTTEMTQGQWLAVMGENPSKLPGDLNRPVEGVSWEDCQLMIHKLNETKLGQQFRFRLPTEAEWEYAARAGSAGNYAHGDDPQRLPEYAWFKDNSEDKTHAVGQLKPNAWGLYDMQGNVREWCHDYMASFRGGAAVDPTGPPRGEFLVVHGGSFGDPATNLFCKARFNNKRTDRHRAIGLRLAADRR
jgi:formylglycine-generating enzyme required for sulfatase activity